MKIDSAQVAKFSDFLKTGTESEPFDFISAGPDILFPPLNAPYAIDYFFAVTLHQFGFWYAQNGMYTQPMYITVDNKTLKGSDYMWYASLRALKKDPRFLDPGYLSSCTQEEYRQFYLDDNGDCRLPMFDEHYALTRAYARHCMNTKLRPTELLTAANRSKKPLEVFLQAVAELPGYREDPLQKKSGLLALILFNRPEHFLTVHDHSNWLPIIDYHIQRSLLRTGMLEITDPELRSSLEKRSLISEETGEKIRHVCYTIILQLLRDSGRDLGTIDFFFFSNRKKCPEMTTPECPACTVQHICKKYTGLFQPVYRTTAY